jgi:hypothetical protein
MMKAHVGRTLADGKRSGQPIAWAQTLGEISRLKTKLGFDNVFSAGRISLPVKDWSG